jgi:hypothetical protein
VNHTPYPHVIDTLDRFQHSNLTAAIDCPRAHLHAERCPCGAMTVRPYSDDLIALMRREWGVRCKVDERARARVLSMTYDPIERDDLASGEVWADSSPA